VNKKAPVVIMVCDKRTIHPKGEKQRRGTMIIPKNLNQVTLKKVEAEVTGKMGLSWVNHCMKHYGLEETIEKHCPRESGSNREIAASRKIIAGALTLIAGGDRIEDIETLRADKALLNTLGWERIISPDTFREFCLEKENAGRLTTINREMAVKAMKDAEIKEFTYDNDATYFDSGKESATYSYKGRKQFSALLGFIAELNICTTVSFRRGHVQAGVGIYEQLKDAIKQAKSVGKRIVRFRSDSAAHQNTIFEECDKEGIAYYISLDKNEAVVKCIKALKAKDWQRLSGRYKEQKNTEWAETVYVTEKGNSMRALVLRWPNPERDLFTQEPYCYHVIGTNNNDIEAMKWLEVHNGRMNSESYNKELRSGFNGEYTPSHEFTMNENYFLIGVLAYNMVQVMKLFYLSEGAGKWTVKTLRYRFIYACGKIIRTGRRYICTIINVTQETFELFQSCLRRLVVTT